MVFPMDSNADSSSIRNQATFIQRGPCKRAKPGPQLSWPSGKSSFDSKEVSHADFSAVSDRLCSLPEDDQEFLTTKSKFVGALGALAKHTTVVGIHRCMFEGPSAQARQETFCRQKLAVEAARGNANVRYAWHGTSKKGVFGILKHGFGQPGVPRHGSNYGSGVYFAPEGKSIISAMYSDVDAYGAQHVLLCKVIMGKMEQVSEGSKQFSPSSEVYDSGIDNVAHPLRYIVWSTHMNTHILPLFVVSFKLVPSLQYLFMYRKKRHGVSLVHCLCSQLSLIFQCKDETSVSEKEAYNNAMEEKVEQNRHDGSFPATRRAPQSPWISFSELFSMMQNRLSPSVATMLLQLYDEFQVGRLPRTSFVRLIRALTGDAILQQCIMNRTVGSFY